VKLASSGHWYFCLKDPGAQIECAMFRTRAQFLDFRPQNGMQVEVRARVTLYEPRGNYQLVVEEVRKAGLGALFEAFEKLKARLQAEGLFEPARKKPIPAFPRAIGIVTSPGAAALRDVLTTLARRARMTPVIVYPAQVQGEGAAAQVVRAIEAANARGECDVLIVCRGGGSLEDLWTFNEEAVARAIAASVLPVVSGVGHETDFSIADFVADLRAPTPTAAAVAASADREALLANVAQLRRRLARDAQRIVERRREAAHGLARRLVRDMRRIVETRAQRLDHLSRRLLTPAQRLERDRERLLQTARRLRRAAANVDLHRREVARLRERLHAAFARSAESRTRRLAAARTALGHLDPTQVLARGYAIVRDANGHVVMAARSLAAGDALDVTFSEGGAGVTVRETR
jgi:exodeoxyribonuclease VII large subunit